MFMQIHMLLTVVWLRFFRHRRYVLTLSSSAQIEMSLKSDATGVKGGNAFLAYPDMNIVILSIE